MGSAPGLAAHLARRTLLLNSVLSPAFYLPLPPVEEMRADLAHQLASVEHEQDILDLARRWANDRRFQVGVQQLKAIVRPAQAGLAYSDIAAATISALCDRVEQRFAEAPWRLSRPAAGGARAWASSAAARCRPPPTST